MNIFATSRPNTDIASRFEGGTLIEIYAKGEDIREYLNGNMHRLPDFVCTDAELKNEIETTIVNSVQGMLGASTYLSPCVLTCSQVSSC